jgi:hypothetical protein
MQTLADLKRRMVLGTKLMKTEYKWKRSDGEFEHYTLDNPQLIRPCSRMIGEVREVTKVQTNAWRLDTSWLDIPKAKELTIDEDGEGFSIQTWEGKLTMSYRFV